MYRLTFFFAALFLLNSCAAQRQSGMSQFYKKYKADEYAEGMHVPHILLQLSASDHEAKTAIRHIRSLNILHVGKTNNKNLDALHADLDRAFKADHYEDLLKVSGDGDRIGLYITERGNCVNNVVLVIDESDEWTLIHLKTKVTPDQLSRLVEKVQSADSKTNWNDVALSLTGSGKK